jgi:cell wall-associated NlpC family hydrolase
MSNLIYSVEHFIAIYCDTDQDSYLIKDLLEKKFENKKVRIQNNKVYLGAYNSEEIKNVQDYIISKLNLPAKVVSLENEFFYNEDICLLPSTDNNTLPNSQEDFVIEITSTTKFVDSNTIDLYLDDNIKKIISYAAELYGTTPYKFGGENIKKGLDCSYFVKYIYSRLGVTLPRTSREQIKIERNVSETELKCGELVFFKKVYYKKRKNKTYKYERINHVGIYLKDGEFIHAARSNKKVTISSLNENYYKKHFAGARRIINGL